MTWNGKGSKCIRTPEVSLDNALLHHISMNNTEILDGRAAVGRIVEIVLSETKELLEDPFCFG